MNIQKFKTVVTIEKEIEVEVNLDIINEGFISHFDKYMFSANDVEDIVEHIAYQAANHDGYFIEGIGEWPNSRDREKNLSRQGVHIKILDEGTGVTIETD